MPYDDFTKITRLTEVFEQARVQNDLNNDIAGREVGRMRRVDHGDVGTAIEAKKRRERNDRLLFETALDALMRDPVYRKRHETFGQFLDSYSAQRRPHSHKRWRQSMQRSKRCKPPWMAQTHWKVGLCS